MIITRGNRRGGNFLSLILRTYLRLSITSSFDLMVRSNTSMNALGGIINIYILIIVRP
jgi:hypothetical protein